MLERLGQLHSAQRDQQPGWIRYTGRFVSMCVRRVVMKYVPYSPSRFPAAQVRRWEGEFRSRWLMGLWCFLAGWMSLHSWDCTTAQEIPEAARGNSEPVARPLTIEAEQERRLERADELAAMSRYDLAVPLWQKVLEEAGDQLVVQAVPAETPGKHYQRLRPVALQIEATLAKLPPAGLREYRVNTDPEARSLLAAATGDLREAALAEVVRKYFLSSVGDEAAFELACLQLERQEYAAGLRLLKKLTSYPQSEISPANVLLRLAVAQARIGNAKEAQQTLRRLASQGNLVSARNLELVTEDVEQQASQTTAQVVAVAGWPMRFGTAAHDGAMRRLPDAGMGTGYAELRECRPAFPLLGIPELPEDVPKIYMSTKGQTKQMIYVNGVIIDPDVYQRERGVVVNRHEIVERWKKRGGNLVGDPLLVGDHVVVDAGDRIVCYDAATGALRWQGHPRPYDVDPLSKSSLLMKIADQRYGYRAQTSPYGTFAELQLFGDALHHAMSSSGGQVFLVTGDRESDEAAPQEEDQQLNWAQLEQRGFQRKCRNALAAYEVGTGKLVWNRSASPDGEKRTAAGFLCAPVPTGQRLVVPVSAAGKCWLFGLQAEDGATVWRTFLGEEPVRSVISAARASVAIDAGEAFVSAGMGTAYCVDAQSGAVKWGVRYGGKDTGGNGVAGDERSDQSRRVGLHDTVIVSGGVVIVMPSDWQHLFAVDRSTGEVLWQHPFELNQEPSGRIAYCLGVLGGRLYLAGPQAVRALDLSSGELVWKQTLQRSYGRGAMTENALYLPDGGDVVQLNLATGKVAARTLAVTTSREPLGNLYSNGRHLWVQGVGRLYALGDLQQRLTELNQLIEAGDGQAYLSRCRVNSRLQKTSAALDDLKTGYTILSQQRSPAEANRRLFDVVDAVALAKTHPEDAVQWVIKAARLERDRAMETCPSRDRVLQTLLAQKQPWEKVKVEQFIALLPYCRTEALVTVAEVRLSQISTVEDEPVLRAALRQQDPITRRVAQTGLAIVLRKAGKPRLLELLQSKNENERLVGAAALAADAQREALPVLGDLLTSRDQAIRARSISLLRQLTGKSFQFDAAASVYRRRRSTTNWQAWIQGEGQTAPLKTAHAKPGDSGKFTPQQVDALINGGQLIDAVD